MSPVNDARCERHGTRLLYDTFGYPYCPDCEDEAAELAPGVVGNPPKEQGWQ